MRRRPSSRLRRPRTSHPHAGPTQPALEQVSGLVHASKTMLLGASKTTGSSRSPGPRGVADLQCPDSLHGVRHRWPPQVFPCVCPAFQLSSVSRVLGSCLPRTGGYFFQPAIGLRPAAFGSSRRGPPLCIPSARKSVRLAPSTRRCLGGWAGWLIANGFRASFVDRRLARREPGEDRPGRVGSASAREGRVESRLGFHPL